MLKRKQKASSTEEEVGAPSIEEELQEMEAVLDKENPLEAKTDVVESDSEDEPVSEDESVSDDEDEEEGSIPPQKAGHSLVAVRRPIRHPHRDLIFRPGRPVEVIELDPWIEAQLNANVLKEY